MSQSVRDLHQKFSIREVYEFSRANRNPLCVFGYTVPKTYDYNYHEIEYSYPKEKRHDALYDAKKRSKDPDPGKYIPDLATSLKKNWKSIGALFDKAKRETHIDQAIKLSKKTPGPGTYLEQGKKDLEKIPMGKFE